MLELLKLGIGSTRILSTTPVAIHDQANTGGGGTMREEKEESTKWIGSDGCWAMQTMVKSWQVA